MKAKNNLKCSHKHARPVGGDTLGAFSKFFIFFFSRKCKQQHDEITKKSRLICLDGLRGGVAAQNDT